MAQHDRHAEQRRQPARGGRRGDASTRLDHRHRADAGVATGEDGREGDQLGAQDHGPAERPQAMQVDHRLQGAGGDDPCRPPAADEPCRAAALAHAGGQHDAAGAEPARPRRVAQRQLGPRTERGHAGPAVELHAGGLGTGHQPPRILRPAQHAVQLAHAEGIVPAVTRDATRLPLPLQHQHAAGAQLAQPRGATEPRRSAAHHGDVAGDRLLSRHRRARRRACRSGRGSAPPARPGSRSPGSGPW